MVTANSLFDGRDVFLVGHHQPGEIFGEVVLFEQDTYPVSATAVAESGLLLISKVQIRCLFRREEFQKDFIAMLMRKQRYLANRIMFLTAHDVEERFFLFLLAKFNFKTF